MPEPKIGFKNLVQCVLYHIVYQPYRVSVGLFCSTPAVAVGRSVPRKVAMEMLFTGHPIPAQG